MIFLIAFLINKMSPHPNTSHHLLLYCVSQLLLTQSLSGIHSDSSWGENERKDLFQIFPACCDDRSARQGG